MRATPGSHLTRWQVAELAWNRGKDLEKVKQRAEGLVLSASSDTLSRRAAPAPEQWTEHLIDYLGQAKAGGLAGVSTGLRDLDTITLGLYLLAASTGTGKTALAGQIALHVAEHHGPAVFVSMELTDVDLAMRLVSVVTTIKKERLVTGSLTTEQGDSVVVAIERLWRSCLHIAFGSGYTGSDALLILSSANRGGASGIRTPDSLPARPTQAPLQPSQAAAAEIKPSTSVRLTYPIFAGFFRGLLHGLLHETAA